MQKRITIPTIIFLATGLVALIAIIVLWQRAVDRWSELDLAESGDYEMLLRIERLSVKLNKMQVTKRGYLLTGSAAQLEEHHAAVATVTNDLKKLVFWESQFPEAKATLDAIQVLLSERLENYNQSLHSYQQHGFVAGEQVELVNKGALLQNRLEGLINQMVTAETVRLRDRAEQKRAHMQRVVWLTGGALTGVVSAFLLASWLLLREAQARRAAVLSLQREHAELEKALEELKQSHWHLDKVAEVLPICMECGKIKTGDARWETIAKYFHDNDLMLSHGYCPSCYNVAIAKLRQSNSTGSS